jgi:hypothetical protein
MLARIPETPMFLEAQDAPKSPARNRTDKNRLGLLNQQPVPCKMKQNSSTINWSVVVLQVTNAKKHAPIFSVSPATVLLLGSRQGNLAADTLAQQQP